MAKLSNEPYTPVLQKSTTDLLAKINQANKKKLIAKAEVIKARIELANLKDSLIKSGVISKDQISLLLNDIACW